MCGQKCGQCFVLSLFFNGLRLFCDYVAHDGKGRNGSRARHLDAGGGGQGAQGPPAHALRGLHIPEPPGIVASPDQRFDDPLYQRYVSISQHKQKKPPGDTRSRVPRKQPAHTAGNFSYRPDAIECNTPGVVCLSWVQPCGASDWARIVQLPVRVFPLSEDREEG